MKTNIDRSPVKFFCPFNRSHVLGISRFLYEARCRTNERRCISRNEVSKRARDLADPAAERLFRQCLPRSTHVDKAVLSAARDWSLGSSVHAHKRPWKSKPLTADVSANPKLAKLRAELTERQNIAGFHGTKYGRQSFSTGAPYRRTGAWDLRVNNPINILGKSNPPRPERGKSKRFADDWRPNRCKPYPAWASGAPNSRGAV